MSSSSSSSAPSTRILLSDRCYLPTVNGGSSFIPAAVSVDISTGRITAIETEADKIQTLRSAAPSSDVVVIDGKNDILMSGIVDTHVHCNEPGRTDWEGLETATRAAAAGGVTTIGQEK